jgi:hypothetical protein
VLKIDGLELLQFAILEHLKIVLGEVFNRFAVPASYCHINHHYIGRHRKGGLLRNPRLNSYQRN